MHFRPDLRPTLTVRVAVAVAVAVACAAGRMGAPAHMAVTACVVASASEGSSGA